MPTHCSRARNTYTFQLEEILIYSTVHTGRDEKNLHIPPVRKFPTYFSRDKKLKIERISYTF